MKYIVALLFLSVVFLCYYMNLQSDVIILNTNNISGITEILEHEVSKNSEQDALIKQIMGVDFENREQLLFRAFDAPKIEY